MLNKLNTETFTSIKLIDVAPWHMVLYPCVVDFAMLCDHLVLFEQPPMFGKLPILLSASVDLHFLRWKPELSSPSSHVGVGDRHAI